MGRPPEDGPGTETARGAQPTERGGRARVRGCSTPAAAPTTDGRAAAADATGRGMEAHGEHGEHGGEGDEEHT